MLEDLIRNIISTAFGISKNNIYYKRTKSLQGKNETHCIIYSRDFKKIWKITDVLYPMAIEANEHYMSISFNINRIFR